MNRFKITIEDKEKGEVFHFDADNVDYSLDIGMDYEDAGYLQTAKNNRTRHLSLSAGLGCFAGRGVHDTHKDFLGTSVKERLPKI